MKNRKFKSLVMTLTILLLTVMAITNVNAQSLSKSQYIFFDAFTMISGESEDGMMFIDFPMYHFNAGTKTLDSVAPIELTDQTQIIYGSGLGLSGSVGSGASTGLKCYDELSVADLIDADITGKVRYNLEGEWISLAPGEKVEETIETTAYRGFRGKLTVTHRIHNLGIWDKADIIAPNLTPVPEITPIPFVLGDATQDGVVNIIDALVVAQYYVGMEIKTFSLKAADVNQDSKIDIIDALLIAQYYVGMIDSFPAAPEELFQVTEFTSQKWVGGVQGSGGGTQFHGEVTVLVDHIDAIDGIWIGNRYYQPNVKNLTQPGSTIYSQGDELELNCEYRWTPNLPEAGIIASEVPPLEAGPLFNGDALIVCSVDGQEKTFVVPEIKALEPIYYP